MYRKEMIFILGSHCAGKTTFLSKYGADFSCRILLGDSYASPTEAEKQRMIGSIYDGVMPYVIEGQRFFREAVYRGIVQASEKHKDVMTRIIFVYLTPKEMLRRIKVLRKKSPSAYMKEKALYEAQTRFRNKLKDIPQRKNIKIHEVCVDNFSAWSRKVLPLIKYYPLW